MSVQTWTNEERAIFDRDFDFLVQMFVKEVARSYANSHLENKIRNVIADVFYEAKEGIAIIGQGCKDDISPTAGTFRGMAAKNGYGMQIIRPEYLVPTAQGALFDTALSGLTAGSWYGLYHNAAIGGAYNATPLYLRKELGIALVGHMDLGLSLVDAVQWEINNDELPIYDMTLATRGGDLPIFGYPVVEYLRPGKQYRSQFKVNATGGNFVPLPLGVAFASADFMRATAPTAPSTTAP